MHELLGGVRQCQVLYKSDGRVSEYRVVKVIHDCWIGIDERQARMRACQMAGYAKAQTLGRPGDKDCAMS